MWQAWRDFHYKLGLVVPKAIHDGADVIPIILPQPEGAGEVIPLDRSAVEGSSSLVISKKGTINRAGVSSQSPCC